MFWSNVKLILLRELRDQLRDRRTLFAVVGLPLLLYPLMGVLVFHVQQFLKEHKSKVRVIGEAAITMQPPLLQDGRLVGRYGDSSRLELEVVRDWRGSFEQLTARSQTDIRLGVCDAVVYLPPDFGASQEASLTDESSPPASEIIYDAARDKSRVARQRIEAALLAWREALQRQHQPAQAAPPRSPLAFDLKQTDVAPVARRHAALWSKILPFVVLIWALTGAFYPAVDLCAGEKERGTLETLLTSPAGRSEIVWGKLLTIMTFSVATALLNMASMAATGGFVVSHLQRAGASRLPLDLGAPPLAALVWLVVALLPIAALFSALALAIAAFARSSKEGHYYLLPLLMISLPLMLLSLFPGVELDLGFALIPLTGMLLWLRALIEGQYLEALRFGVPVFVMTGLCCLLAIRWAIAQFNDEAVMFRSSERLSLASLFRPLANRGNLPTAGQALLLSAALLTARFFFSLVAPEPTSWNAIAVTTLVMLFGFIAAPACLMAVTLTRRPAQTLLLRGPAHWAMIPVAALLAVSLHPLLLWLNQGIGVLYPINPSAAVKLHEIETFFLGAPLWQALAVVCLAPAICEELAFRGFILSGLRQGSRDWTAIAISSAVFGLAHGILQQSLSATIVGIVIGYLAVQAGSLWPCVAYHALHNGLSLGLSRLDAAAIPSNGILRWVLVVREGGEVTYAWPFVLFAAAVAAGLLWWLKCLPSAGQEEASSIRIDSYSQPAVPATLKLFPQFEAELTPATSYHLVEPSVSE